MDLDGVLPSATIMVVSVTASTTAGQPLPDAEIEQVRPVAAVSASSGAATGVAHVWTTPQLRHALLH